MQAEFELEALLLTGSCVDIAARIREQVNADTASTHQLATCDHFNAATEPVSCVYISTMTIPQQ